MIACIDVHYPERGAFAAAVMCGAWSDGVPMEERVVSVGEVQPYVPGEFFRRELPCVLAVLHTLPPVETVVIDGYVWLAGEAKPGLGAHLYEALDGRAVVVGVAKTKFLDASGVVEILRGSSQRPLFVSAAGLPVEEAAERVRSMHGKSRIPTLLARVDALRRQERIQG